MHRYDSVITYCTPYINKSYFVPRETLKVFMGNIPFLEPYTILSAAMWQGIDFERSGSRKRKFKFFF